MTYITPEERARKSLHTLLSRARSATGKLRKTKEAEELKKELNAAMVEADLAFTEMMGDPYEILRNRAKHRVLDGPYVLEVLGEEARKYYSGPATSHIQDQLCRTFTLPDDPREKAKILREVIRISAEQHEVASRRLEAQIGGDDGRWGIAVRTDTYAIQWQELEAELFEKVGLPSWWGSAKND